MMDLTNSWEQKGIERGRHEGLEQGRNEGLQLAILRLARSRFQPPESDLFSAVNQVHDTEQLTRILDALCQNADLAELRQLIPPCGP